MLVSYFLHGRNIGELVLCVVCESPGNDIEQNEDLNDSEPNDLEDSFMVIQREEDGGVDVFAEDDDWGVSSGKGRDVCSITCA